MSFAAGENELIKWEIYSYCSTLLVQILSNLQFVEAKTLFLQWSQRIGRREIPPDIYPSLACVKKAMYLKLFLLAVYSITFVKLQVAF